MSEAKHTPLPWRLFAENGFVEVRADDVLVAVVNWQGFNDSFRSDDGHLANAEFIVRAVNSHAALVAALEKLMKWIGPPPVDKHSYDSLREDGWKAAKEALAMVKS